MVESYQRGCRRQQCHQRATVAHQSGREQKCIGSAISTGEEGRPGPDSRTAGSRRTECVSSASFWRGAQRRDDEESWFRCYWSTRPILGGSGFALFIALSEASSCSVSVFRRTILFSRRRNNTKITCPQTGKLCLCQDRTHDGR